MNSVSDDNAIATALIASMHRAGVINRRCNSPERLEAVDLHLQNGLDYRVAFEAEPEQRAYMRRQGKRIRRLVLAKLGMTTAVEK
jgi:hypothetical protein